MRQIIKIYKIDWYRTLHTPSLLLLVAGLLILPSAYAWINISALWDPYSNTSGIQVAVTNEDIGAAVQGKTINAGKQVIHKLKRDHRLGWTFVSRTQAEQGLRRGNYYAAIRIPKDFSQKISSILQKYPQRPEIIFSVNEKINSISPKVTASGATALSSQISQMFVKTVGNAVFFELHRAGIEAVQNLPMLKKVSRQIFALEKALPQIKKMGDDAIRLEKKIPEIKASAREVNVLEKKIPDLERAGRQILTVETVLPDIKDAAARISALNSQMSSLQSIAGIMRQMNDSITNIRQTVNQAQSSASDISQISPNIKGDQNQLTQKSDELRSIQDKLQDLAGTVHQSSDSAAETLNSASRFMADGLPQAEQEIGRAGLFVRRDLPRVEQNIRSAADFVQTKWPEAEKMIHRAADFARYDLPGFEQEVHIASRKIRQFSSQVDLNEVIRLLTFNPQRQSDFLARPVSLKTVRVFPIPNYGSSMAPFYTILSLWVGATLLISTLQTNVDGRQIHFTARQAYSGRLFGFLTIGLIQTIIVALGDLFLIHVYVVDKLWFFLFCLFCDLVFIVITYTLSSLAGTIGKGLVVILLVLQISGSGGTFPVSMTSPFFQKISPFLPFTYAISLIRETVGGMVPEVVTRDLLILMVFLLVFVLAGLLLKKRLNALFRV
ncbi:YhgE/Pip domain-containing protein [Sporolactobacillus sp. THM7-4]|nr:YhgE/Pip domain-containing protein [Sporolactobacillus sp. THM7-4]